MLLAYMRLPARLSSLFLFALALLGALHARAQTVEIKTVVVGLSARRGVDEGLAVAMSDVVQGVFTKSPGRKVLGRDDINRVLRFESERQAMGCDTDSCLSEIAQALDVDRLVTGSMDKVGSRYFVVITEIDARTVEPVGRVQGQLPLDEDRLVPAVADLALKLLRQSRMSASPEGPTGGETVGALVVRASPEGARVVVGGREVGVTPLRVDTLPPGTHEVFLTREGYQPVRVAVPVYSGATTEVEGHLAAPPKPSEEALASHKEALGWQSAFGWTKVGSGTLCGLTAPCAGVVAVGVAPKGAGQDIGFVACTSLQAALGIALCSWGIVDLLFPPEAPQAEGSPRHELEILPPPGKGEVQRFEMTATEAAPSAAMPH